MPVEVLVRVVIYLLNNQDKKLTYAEWQKLIHDTLLVEATSPALYRIFKYLPFQPTDHAAYSDGPGLVHKINNTPRDLEIRRLAKAGHSHSFLAAKFGLSAVRVAQIIGGICIRVSLDPRYVEKGKEERAAKREETRKAKFNIKQERKSK
jgi:hypothetical protein